MRPMPKELLVRRYQVEVETLKRRLARGLGNERDKERLALAHRRLMELKGERRKDGKPRVKRVRQRVSGLYG